ncbi:MAG: hypothetical protein H0W44_07970 [Gammaproteobacteria bacterium]|nr:hypothetical protein [Gammaproteobacteria bacterium]
MTNFQKHIIVTLLSIGSFLSPGVYAAGEEQHFFIQGGTAQGKESNNIFPEFSDEINFGDGQFAMVGMKFTNRSPWVFRMAAGYKYNTFSITESGQSFDYEFKAIPLDFVLSYKWKIVEFGAGFTYHLKPYTDFYYSIETGDDDEFDNASGSLAEVRLNLIPHVSFGARYTRIDYSKYGNGTETYFAIGVKDDTLDPVDDFYEYYHTTTSLESDFVSAFVEFEF